MNGELTKAIRRVPLAACQPVPVMSSLRREIKPARPSYEFSEVAYLSRLSTPSRSVVPVRQPSYRISNDSIAVGHGLTSS